ncbi:YdaU family protein [Acidithiobacillus ferruginosus]|uniref:YdaU family protein n=1 Tax=Acidithiobacillus ferruginosus TaxID=3063951 RepID=A0ACD5IES0_9PROT|nr:YdaU family protein [Acidithiobacillus ferruginosus]
MSEDGFATLPPPPVPPDIDLRSHCWMKLDLCRLHSSDFIHLATNEEFGAAVKLWTEAMRQVPAGSLPSDDKILASLAGYRGSNRRWQKVKPMALHGFSLCSDDRLYHPLLAEMALDAWANKAQQPSANPSDPRAKDRERLRRWRAEQRAKKQVGLGQASEEESALASTPAETIETFHERFTETFHETGETFPVNRGETEKETEKKQNIMVSETADETFPETPPSDLAETLSPSREGTLCKKLRALGVRAAPHMVVVQEMCARHSDEHILDAAEIALEKKGAGIHVGYIAAMLKNGATEGKTKSRSAAGPPNRQLIPPVAVGGSHYVKL